MKTNRALIAGLVLVSISILILLTVPLTLDRINDSLMVLILVLLIVGFPFACAGSLLVSSSLPAIGKGIHESVILTVGILISILGGIMWVFFLFTAFLSLYVLAILNVFFIPMSILAGLFGGWMIGVGLPGKKRVEIDE
jgi:hypothetical protein